MVQLFLTPKLRDWLWCHQGEDQTLHTFSKDFLNILGITSKLSGKIPMTGPVLIIANHPNVFDMFTVLSLIDRPDTFIINAALNMRLNPLLRKHSLPVYFSNKPRHSLLDLIRVPYWTYKEGNIPRQEAVKRNKHTITKAATLLNQGHAVVIFPSGSNPHNTQWSKGVGFLLEEVTRNDLHIIFMNIANSSWYDSLRYSFFRYLLPQRTLHIQVQRFQKIQSLLRLPPKKRAQKIKQLYTNTFLL